MPLEPPTDEAEPAQQFKGFTEREIQVVNKFVDKIIEFYKQDQNIQEDVEKLKGMFGELEERKKLVQKAYNSLNDEEKKIIRKIVDKEDSLKTLKNTIDNKFLKNLKIPGQTTQATDEPEPPKPASDQVKKEEERFLKQLKDSIKNKTAKYRQTPIDEFKETEEEFYVILQDGTQFPPDTDRKKNLEQNGQSFLISQFEDKLTMATLADEPKPEDEEVEVPTGDYSSFVEAVKKKMNFDQYKKIDATATEEKYQSFLDLLTIILNEPGKKLDEQRKITQLSRIKPLAAKLERILGIKKTEIRDKLLKAKQQNPKVFASALRSDTLPLKKMLGDWVFDIPTIKNYDLSAIRKTAAPEPEEKKGQEAEKEKPESEKQEKSEAEAKGKVEAEVKKKEKEINQAASSEDPQALQNVLKPIISIPLSLNLSPSATEQMTTDVINSTLKLNRRQQNNVVQAVENAADEQEAESVDEDAELSNLLNRVLGYSKVPKQEEYLKDFMETYKKAKKAKNKDDKELKKEVEASLEGAISNIFFKFSGNSAAATQKQYLKALGEQNGNHEKARKATKNIQIFEKDMKKILDAYNALGFDQILLEDNPILGEFDSQRHKIADADSKGQRLENKILSFSSIAVRDPDGKNLNKIAEVIVGR